MTVYILPYKNGERDDLKKLNALYTSYRRRWKRWHKSRMMIHSLNHCCLFNHFDSTDYRHQLIENLFCNTPFIDVGKIYTTWTEWSPCDKTCTKSRERFCSEYNPTKYPEAQSFGVHTQSEKCSNEECYSMYKIRFPAFHLLNFIIEHIICLYSTSIRNTTLIMR